MAFNIDGVTYPDTLDGILKDSKLKPLFERFAKKVAVVGDVIFTQMKAGKNSEQIYKTFLAPNAKFQVNISSSLSTRAKNNADRAEKGTIDWDSNLINAVIEEAQATVKELIQDNYCNLVDTGFYKSDIFKKHHETIRQAQVKKITDKIDKKKLQVLGYVRISEGALKVYVQQMVAYFLTGNEAAAKDVYEKIKRFEPKESLGAVTPFNKMEKLLKTTGILPK